MIAIEKGMDMTLTPAGYRPRLADPLIDDMLKRFGCVSIEGTKYCGKTWTARTHCNSMYALDDSSQNYRNHTLASIDMNYALEGEPPHLIDEWQMIPAIWDGVRRDVDMSGSNRKYILCRSSVPIKPGVDDIQTHSGMGRIVPIRIADSVENGSGWTTPSFMCVLCGVCSAAYRRDDGVYVVPITSLRN